MTAGENGSTQKKTDENDEKSNVSGIRVTYSKSHVSNGLSEYRMNRGVIWLGVAGGRRPHPPRKKKKRKKKEKKDNRKEKKKRLKKEGNYE